MNEYIIPVCEIGKSKVYNKKFVARSYRHCQEKIMEYFSDYSDSDDWNTFKNDLDSQDILLGEISDISEL